MVGLTRKRQSPRASTPSASANGKKRAANSLASEGNDVPSPAKKAKIHHSLNSFRASRLNSINTIPQTPVNTEPLDFFCWGTGSMCELGLGPDAKTKEVKRPRLNPFLTKDKVGIVDFAVGEIPLLPLKI
ncbi:unnamed protein product [[Candida] boidinii]|nr:unnamed protein product [[Candida] boidinii]